MGDKQKHKDKDKKTKEGKKRSSSSSSAKVKKKKEKTKEKDKKEKDKKAKEEVKEKAKADQKEAAAPAAPAAVEEKMPEAAAKKAAPEKLAEKPTKKLKAWQDDELEIESDEEVGAEDSDRKRALAGVVGQAQASASSSSAPPGAAAAAAAASSGGAAPAAAAAAPAGGEAPGAEAAGKDDEADPLDAFMADVKAELEKPAAAPDAAAGGASSSSAAGAPSGMGVMDASRVKSISLEEIEALMGQASPSSPAAAPGSTASPEAAAASGSRSPPADAAAAMEDEDEDDKFHAAFLAELRKFRDGGGAAGSEPVEYVAATSFEGAKAGMCFKVGPQGLGYYTDVPGKRLAAQKAKAEEEKQETVRRKAEEESKKAAKAAKKAAAEAAGEDADVDSDDESSEEAEGDADSSKGTKGAPVAEVAAAVPQSEEAGKVVETKKEKRRKRREAKEADKRSKEAAGKRKAVDGFGGNADQLMENDAERSEESSEGEQESYFDLVKRFTTKKSLPPVDHSTIVYPPFRKNLYIQVKEITNMKDHEVEDWRRTQGDIKVRGKHCPHPIKSFLQCGLPDKILKIMEKRDYEKPFPIQMQAIPALMCGRDMIGVAQTGSGKTLAYLLPAIRHILDQSKLEDGDGPIAFIVAPTRELALQITREANVMCKAVGLASVSAVGGSPMGEQLSLLRKGCHLLVGTPGRLIDVLTISGGKITNLRRVTFMVLDEADRMFDMGFEPQIGMFLQTTRPDKQVALFSATLPTHVEALARTVLKRPLEITVGERNTAATNVTQFVEVLEETQKFYRLLQLMGEWHEHGSIIIFVHQQKDVDEMFTELLKFGYPSLPLHGGQDQCDRDFTLQDFKDGVANILIATSVAARGIDVKQVVLVINFKVPDHLEDYIHRIGRTGRAGKAGFAYTFVQPDEAEHAQDMVDALRQCGQEIPLKLKALAEEHQSQVNTGNAKKKRKWGGFGGKSFKYDSSEKSQQQKDRQKAKCDMLIGNADERKEEEEKMKDPWNDEKPMSKAAQERKKKEEEEKRPPPQQTSGTSAFPSSTVAAAAAVAAKMQADAAKVVLPGQTAAAPTPGVGSTPADFIPSTAFTGSRPGMSFKRGDQGLGYYADVSVQPPPPPQAAPEADFIAAAAWEGAKPGMAFKLGDQGLGYYADGADGADGAAPSPSSPSGSAAAPTAPGAGALALLGGGAPAAAAAPPPPPPPGASVSASAPRATKHVYGRRKTDEELDEEAEAMAESTLKTLLEGENGDEVREKRLPPLKAKLKEKLRKADEEQAGKATTPVAPPPPPKFEAAQEREPVMEALAFVPGVLGGGSDDSSSMILRSMAQLQEGRNRTVQETQDQAAEMAAMLASGNTIAPAGMFIEEFEINDYPEIARKRISHREPLAAIEELSGGAKLWIKGQYHADARKMPEGARKLFVEITGPTQITVQKAKNEVRKMMEALAIRTLNIPGVSRDVIGRAGRYDPATGK